MGLATQVDGVFQTPDDQGECRVKFFLDSGPFAELDKTGTIDRLYATSEVKDR
jgi:hypothetical protein